MFGWLLEGGPNTFLSEGARPLGRPVRNVRWVTEWSEEEDRCGLKREPHLWTGREEHRPGRSVCLLVRQ